MVVNGMTPITLPSEEVQDADISMVYISLQSDVHHLLGEKGSHSLGFLRTRENFQLWLLHRNFDQAEGPDCQYEAREGGNIVFATQ